MIVRSVCPAEAGHYRCSWRRAFAGPLVVLACAAQADAQVVRMEILSRQPVANGYEVIRGRIHGEVDPKDPHNQIIQDVNLAPVNARGRVEYVATFALAKPVDMSKASGVLIYTVVNRGNGDVAPNGDGHVSLVSGWQGDVIPTANNQTIVVPIAKQPDATAVTGPVLARFFNIAPGTNTIPIRLSSMGNAPPVYQPASLDQTEARLISATAERADGVKTGVVTVPRDAWAFADCRTAAFPGTPDPTRVCLKDGFDSQRLYELTYTAKDPLVLGVGLAATRDITAFFRHAAADAAGTPNPVAGAVTHAIAIGDSQSGNLIKTFLHLGFNQDLNGRIVWDGVFPRIAGRQTPINLRFALPGGAAGMYEPGSDPAVWWGPYDDRSRGLGRASLLDRCTATRTCPKIIEAFGSAEFWGLRMSPGLIGTDAKTDIPLPDNVRRYYYPGTTHGGGRGGFRIDSSGLQGGCTLPANPNPQSDTTRALTAALVEWVTRGTAPPLSRYPRLAQADLVAATKTAVGFPDVPGLTFIDHLVNPVLDYDFGPEFIARDLSGVITRQPPRIKQVIPTYVPRVNEDGNEMAGVPSVLHQAPLGTYLGWNVTASGFFKGQACGFAGGYWPFAKTKAERLASQDPRPSVEERYGTLDGYVCVVRRAAEQAVSDRFLLRADADRLIKEASASGVLPANGESSADAVKIANALCSR
jgi:Alpha/beta hydrolase domain